MFNKKKELLNLKKEQNEKSKAILFDPVLEKAEQLLKDIPLISSFNRSEESDEKNDDHQIESKKSFEGIEKENKKYFEEQIQEINKQRKPIVERFWIENAPKPKEEETKSEEFTAKK